MMSTLVVSVCDTMKLTVLPAGACCTVMLRRTALFSVAGFSTMAWPSVMAWLAEVFCNPLLLKLRRPSRKS